MMKFLSCMFFFICLQASAQECSKYRIGKFEVDNEDGTVSTIKRTEKYQIERSEVFMTKDRIEWVSECEYRLIPVKIKAIAGEIGNAILTFTMLEVKEFSYVVRVSGCGDPFDVEVFEKGHLNDE